MQGFITGCYLTRWKLDSTALLVLTAMQASHPSLQHAGSCAHALRGSLPGLVVIDFGWMHITNHRRKMAV